MQMSGKIHKIYAKMCKNKPPFRHKTLILLKNPVKIDGSTYESVQQVGVPGSILSGVLGVFMHFYEGPDGFRPFFFVTFDLF